MHRDSARFSPRGRARAPRQCASRRNEGEHECLLSLVPVGLLQEGTSFSRNGTRLRPLPADSIGRIVSSTLVAIVILDVPFDVGGANDDSTISPLLSRATPGSCFLRREPMIVYSRASFTPDEENGFMTNILRAIRNVSRSFSLRFKKI